MSNKSFTLMELIIVVVIIGIIAAFAIPNYRKSMARQQVKRLILTANLIAGAQEIYKSKNGRYWCVMGWSCSAPPDLNKINTALGLNIVPETGILYMTWAMSALQPDKGLEVIITDQNTFRLTLRPPSPIDCTNLSGTNVCP